MTQIITSFSTETVEARKEQSYTSNMVKENSCLVSQSVSGKKKRKLYSFRQVYTERNCHQKKENYPLMAIQEGRVLKMVKYSSI